MKGASGGLGSRNTIERLAVNAWLQKKPRDKHKIEPNREPFQPPEPRELFPYIFSQG